MQLGITCSTGKAGPHAQQQAPTSPTGPCSSFTFSFPSCRTGGSSSPSGSTCTSGSSHYSTGSCATSSGTAWRQLAAAAMAHVVVKREEPELPQLPCCMPWESCPKCCPHLNTPAVLDQAPHGLGEAVAASSGVEDEAGAPTERDSGSLQRHHSKRQRRKQRAQQRQQQESGKGQSTLGAEARPSAEESQKRREPKQGHRHQHQHPRFMKERNIMKTIPIAALRAMFGEQALDPGYEAVAVVQLQLDGVVLPQVSMASSNTCVAQSVPCLGGLGGACKCDEGVLLGSAWRRIKGLM